MVEQSWNGDERLNLGIQCIGLWQNSPNFKTGIKIWGSENVLKGGGEWL
jgi:hypothetical protein